MSTTTRGPERADVGRRGHVVATVDRYAEAQRIVDQLSDEGFPVEHAAIVGRDLRYVERVTGRRGYGRAAAEGAGAGALLGALLGILLSVFTLWEPVMSAIALILWWTVVGAILGAILGALGHAMQRGQRDFSSVRAMEATEIDVVVDPDHADRAMGIIGATRTSAAATGRDRSAPAPGAAESAAETGTTPPR